MSRIRTIKPEFWSNEKVMACSRDARLLFIGLWNYADDAGRLPNSSKSIKAQIFPGDDDVASENVRRMIVDLSSNDLVREYEVDGRSYLQITGWDHQRIDRPKPSKIPPPNFDDDSTINPRSIAPDLTLSNLKVSNLKSDGAKNAVGVLATAPPTGALARPPSTEQAEEKRPAEKEGLRASPRLTSLVKEKHWVR